MPRETPGVLSDRDEREEDAFFFLWLRRTAAQCQQLDRGVTCTQVDQHDDIPAKVNNAVVTFETHNGIRTSTVLLKYE